MPHRAISVSRTGAGISGPDSTGAFILTGVPGTSASFRWHGERVHYRALGSGPPLVLLHAPDVGGSCVEWRRNMGHFAGTHTVFAIDLPGYGMSDIHRGPYTAEMYVQFLGDFLRVLTGPDTSVIGCVLSASYLVHAADKWPNLVGRMVLICPAGLSAFRPNSLGSTAFHMLRIPGLSGALLGNATSRYGILEHLQADVYLDQTHAGPHAVDTRYWVCHRTNADYVETSRLAGMQNLDIRAEAPRIQCPVLLAWGRHAQRPPLSDSDEFLRLCPSAKLAVFERSGLAPQEEESFQFDQLVGQFLAEGAPPPAETTSE